MEAVVALAGPAVVDWVVHDGVRPALGFGESFAVILALHAHAGFVAALAARGITDLDKVQIDPWPTGSFGDPAEGAAGWPAASASTARSRATTATPAPSRGSRRLVDMARGEVLQIIDDDGVVPLPPERGSYLPEDHPPPLRPEAPGDQPARRRGFALDGNVLRWQGWSLHVSLDPLEGIVLRDVGYDDGGRVRSILQRAASARWWCPTATPAPTHGWKNAFDVGEWGLGRLANSLALGCDCLGEIHYLDAVLADEQGEPRRSPNAICLHEEDVGILWKHQDLFTGRTEVRRSRRMVISSIATVGNYEYGFYWYLYQDGTLELEVKLTGILSTKGLPGGGRRGPRPARRPRSRRARPPAPLLRPPRRRRRRPVNEVHEVDVAPLRRRRGRVAGQRLRPRGHPPRHRAAGPPARRPGRAAVVDRRQPRRPQRPRPPVAYKLTPGPAPTLLADEGSSIAARAGFARHNLWVTPFARRAAPGRRLPEPARRGRRPPAVDRRRPVPGRSAGGGLAHVRRHPRAPARGLAGDAGGDLRVPPRPPPASSTATRPSTSPHRPTATEAEGGPIAFVCAMPMELRPLTKRLGLRDTRGRRAGPGGHPRRPRRDRRSSPGWAPSWPPPAWSACSMR